MHQYKPPAKIIALRKAIDLPITNVASQVAGRYIGLRLGLEPTTTAASSPSSQGWPTLRQLNLSHDLEEKARLLGSLAESSGSERVIRQGDIGRPREAERDSVAQLERVKALLAQYARVSPSSAAVIVL